MELPDRHAPRRTPATRASEHAVSRHPAPAPTRSSVGSPAPQGRRTSFAAALAGSLTVAGCASGIEKAEGACAAHRATASAFVSCLRANHTTLASGMRGERDLGTYYLAMAEHQAGRVARGETTDPEAMLEIAKFRMGELAGKEKERQEAAKKEWADFKEALGETFGAGKSFGASLRQSRLR